MFDNIISTCDNVYSEKTNEVAMIIFEIRDETGKVRATDTDFGNMAELAMIMSEIEPNRKFRVVDIDEMPGA